MCFGSQGKINNVQISNFRWITGRRSINIWNPKYFFFRAEPQLKWPSLLLWHIYFSVQITFQTGFLINGLLNVCVSTIEVIAVIRSSIREAVKFNANFLLCLAAVWPHFNGQWHDYRMLRYRIIFNSKLNCTPIKVAVLFTLSII